MGATKGLVSLHKHTDSPEPLLLDNTISTVIMCAGSYDISETPISFYISVNTDINKHELFGKILYILRRIHLQYYWVS